MVSHRKKYNVKPTVVEGKQWHLIAVWTELNNISGNIDQDIWISGELDDFVAEYKSGVREFGKVKIADGVEVSVNGEPIGSVFTGFVPHVPERCVVVDGNSSDEIELVVTAGYGPVEPGPEMAILVRQTRPDRPERTVQFWAPHVVEEY